MDKRLLDRLIQEEIWSQTVWPYEEPIVTVWWETCATPDEVLELSVALKLLLSA